MDEGTLMGLRGTLARLRHMRPESGLALCGLEIPGEVLAAAGWPPHAVAPDATGTVLCLGTAGPPNDAVLLCALGEARTVPAGYHEVLRRTFYHYRPLNDWLATRTGWLPATLAHPARVLWKKSGAREVVGARMCRLRHPLWVEQYFLKDGESLPSAVRETRADRMRDLGMTVLGIGHTPLFAANTASLATTLLLALVWLGMGPGAGVGLAVGLLVAATAGCVAFEPWATRRYLTEDAREVVLDEVAGMALTLLFLPSAPVWWMFAVGFCAFRVFDIFKPAIHWVENTGWRGTIVWDDLLAGLYAGGATWIFLQLMR